MAPDVFQRAQQTIERESRLLNRDYDAVQPPEPLPGLAPMPDTHLDLCLANESFDPRRVKTDTRAAALKRLLQRILGIYTNGQVAFNSSTIRVVNAIHGRLHRLHDELAELARMLDRRVASRLEVTEERRTLWESRFAGRVQDLEERLAALEADVSEVVAEREADRKRIQELEEAMRGMRSVGEEPRRKGQQTPSIVA